MTPPADRRATPRFQAKPGSQIIYGATPVAVRDLSLDGIFVVDPDPLPVGSELAFTLHAAGQDITLDGIVRHVVEQQGMGIQFVNVSAVSKRRLRIYIASLVPVPNEFVNS
jgi:hypothetical protein